MDELGEAWKRRAAKAQRLLPEFWGDSYRVGARDCIITLSRAP